MGFLDKIKENIQETATLAKEGFEDLQTKRELGQAYGELGRRVVELVDAGKLSAPELVTELERVRELKAQLEAEERAAGTPQ